MQQKIHVSSVEKGQYETEWKKSKSRKNENFAVESKYGSDREKVEIDLQRSDTLDKS